VDDVVGEWPLRIVRDDRVKPLGMWHVVEGINEKASVETGKSTSGTRPETATRSMSGDGGSRG
jgi:hypothetical protein